jgi:hypothetical protein
MMDHCGIVATFDALAFLLLTVVAAVALIGTSVMFSGESSQANERFRQRAVQETLDAYLASTVVSAAYVASNGTLVSHPPGSTQISYLIGEELAQRRAGVMASAFTGYESALRGVLANLTFGTYEFVLVSKLAGTPPNADVLFTLESTPSRPNPRASTYVAGAPIAMPDGFAGQASVELTIWLK